MMSNPTLPLVVIVGPTCSGKSACAMQIAQEHNGEIICADSRTVYKYLDIGTAKPSHLDQSAVPHHMIDLVEPDTNFNASEFKRQAEARITEIRNRKKLPILVGGTGLYVDAILYDYTFSGPSDPEQRASLSTMSVPELQAEITRLDLQMPLNQQNPRHLMRTIETGGVANTSSAIRSDAIVFGITVNREQIRHNSQIRTEKMIHDGLIAEAEAMSATYGWDAPGLQAPAYKVLKEYSLGSLKNMEIVDKIVLKDVQLAKRQKTWFKRNKSIHWCENIGEIVDLLTIKLNKS